jgi:hypothetical protein
LAWAFSRRERKPVYGLSLVLLVWTNDTLHITLGMRLWRPGSPSKIERPLELLSYARQHLHCRPA